jgi:hydroxymethylpyrimidine pyrophosphatase-like HAD family hydrolase
VRHRHLFVTDLDGTLLTDDRTISHRDLETLHRLRARGDVVAAATGRSLYSFQQARAHIETQTGPLPLDYLIFSTGAGILRFTKNEIIRHRIIFRSDVVRITACFERMHLDYMVHKAIPETHYFFFRSHGRDNPDFFQRISLYQPFASPLAPDTPVLESATQVLAVIPPKRSLNEVVQIREELSEYSVVHATSPLDHRSAWIEVFHPRVSKSIAAAWLAEQLKIPRSRVVAVGNDFNDQDLLAWAGQSFWVANAAPELNTGIRLPESNNDNGVTRAAQLAGLLPAGFKDSITTL